MTADSARAKTVFGNALEIDSPVERSAYLEKACADNPDLRTEVEELLLAVQAAGNFIEQPLLDVNGVRTPQEETGTSIGPFRLREQIGEGGMGIVFAAEQVEPVRRMVALKLIKPGMDSKQIVARFEAERQALAMMDHPHVARVLDAGSSDDGRPYFVMELVEGVAITEFCDQNKLPTDERLRLFVDACHGVQHAHQKGIIHRDLKPSNILVTVRDDKPIVKVIDFGVAKALHQPSTEGTVYTCAGQMIGTPMYMSPEQAQLNEVDVDTRSDVYSLGMLLYELLTGTTPFDPESFRKAGFDEMRRMIREEEPLRPSARLSTLEWEEISTVADRRNLSPRRASQHLQGDLDWIVVRALEKDRNRRYESPNALADDIRRFLSGEMVRACPPSVGYRVSKFARRNRRVLTSAAVLLVALLAFGAWTVRQSQLHIQNIEGLLEELSEEKAESDRAGQVARLEALRARNTSYVSEMKLAFQRFEEGRLMEASDILANHIPGEGEQDLRGIEWHYLHTSISDRFRVIGSHAGGVEDLAVFPDGERVAVVCMDGSLSVWQLTNCERLQHYQLHHRPVHAVAVSPDGRWIAYGMEDYPFESHVVLLDAESGLELARLNQFDYTIRALDFSADGRYLVSAALGDGEVNVWEFLDGTAGQLHKLTRTTSGVTDVRIVDGDRMLMVEDGASKQLQLWDIATQTLIGTVNNPRGNNPSTSAYSPFHRLAAYAFSRTGQRDGDRSVLDLVDADSGTRLAELSTDARERTAFSADGQLLLAGSYRGWLEAWRIQPTEGSAAREFEIEEQPRVRVANGTVKSICPLDSELVLVGGSDGVVSLSRFGEWVPATRIEADEVRATSIAASPDTNLFAWVGSDSRVRLTDYRTGQVLDTSEELPGFARTLVFSPCGTLLAAQCDQEILQCWEISNQTLESLGRTGFGKEIASDHVAIDRQNVFGFGDEHDQCYLLETDDLTRIAQTLHPTFASNKVLLSPDGRTLVMSGNELRIYDRKSLTLQHRFVDAGSVYGMTISRDSRFLATGHRDGSIYLRHLATGELMHRLNGHNFAVRALAFTSGDTRLVSGDGGGILGFWNVESGDCYGFRHEFTGLNDWIRKISIGPDERWMDINVGYRLPHRWTKRVFNRPTESRNQPQLSE